MRVAVPSAETWQSVLEFGLTLKELQTSASYEFDFEDVSFVTPGWLVVVGAAIRRFREDRPAVKRRATNYKHLGYAAHVGFFKYFGMTYGQAPSQAPGSDTYLPITEVDVATIKERAAKAYVNTGEIVEEEARQLARMLTRQEDGALVDTLTYSIREIVRNVLEHSYSTTYTIAAQYWPNQGKAELAVADAGRGMVSSLKENPKLRVDTDLDALKLAMLPGISSKAWRRTGSYDAWANSGYGLFMTQRLCSLGGQFTVLTGTSGIRVIEGELQELRTFAPGATVILRLDTSANQDLAARLADFRNEGRELAKKVGGANRFGPSLASQILRPTSS
jgi:anti-sigma regulatory factor (Ser/Thr protein kinase)